MCVSCFSSFEALAMNGAGALAIAVTGAGRVVDKVRGRSSEQRRSEVWTQNAAFMRSLGHDPVAVLGPPPEQAVEPSSSPTPRPRPPVPA